MSKRKRLMIEVARGGATQAEIAATVHCSKRDVSQCAKIVGDLGLTVEELLSMSDEAVDGLFPDRGRRGPDPAYLQPDIASYVERKRANRKIPVLNFWTEYVRRAGEAGKEHYAYSTFCQMFSDEAERTGATRHFTHVPGAKAYIDWAGDVAHLTDRVTGARTKVYIFVLELPFSNKFWAEGFCDMRQPSWQEGHVHAFEAFGGVPGMLVPDNAPTATNHSAPSRGVTLLNEEYERFADHYGTAVLPARVRRPRDKSTSESTVNLVESWIVAPSEEMTFYTLQDFNEYCAERVAWLNERPFSAKDGSRDTVFEEYEKGELLPLPPERYEMCEWSTPKVAPDYHVQVDHMRYSVPHTLIGEEVDAKASPTRVTIYHKGEVVAEHPRLRGRRNQYRTLEEHMPEAHRALDDPWSRERFERWAGRIGPETGIAIARLMGRHPIVQQSFVACRNILGLAKSYTPDLLERACAVANGSGAYPTYTGLKRTVLALRASDSADAAAEGGEGQPLVDRAGSAGLTRGADAYRRGAPKGGE